MVKKIISLLAIDFIDKGSLNLISYKQMCLRFLPIPQVGFADLAHMGAQHYMPLCFAKLSFI